MNILEKILSRLPLGLEAVHNGVLHHVLAHASSRISLQLVTGKSVDGEVRSMLLAGDHYSSWYLIQRFFPAPPQRQVLDPLPLNALSEKMEELMARQGHILLLLPRRITASLPEDRFLIAPGWVNIMSTRETDGQFHLPSSSSLQSDLRLVRKNGLVVTTTHDPRALESFIATMYRPFMKNRFQGMDENIKTSTIIRRFRHGGLMQVHGEGELKAGAVYYSHKNTFHFFVLGTRDGSQDPVRQGALAALYAHTFILAKQLDCRHVSFGGCRPVLSDGITRYKRKWGGRLVLRNELFYEYGLGWNHLDGCLRSFLNHNPLIFRRRGRLFGLWTPSDHWLDDHEALMRELRLLNLDGLDRLFVGLPKDALVEKHLPSGVEPIHLDDLNPVHILTERLSSS